MYSSRIENKHLSLPIEILAQMNLEDGQQVILSPIDESTFEVRLVPKPNSSKEQQREQIRRECEELAQLDLSDVGDEENWLILGNEALRLTEQMIKEEE